MTQPANTDAQIRDLERILARQPESRFFAALAEAYIERGDPQRAVEVCQRGLQANPGFVRGLLAYARACMALGRTEEARGAYQEARTQSPRDSSVATAWAVVLATHGLTDEARETVNEALRINPLDVDARRLLGGLPGGPASGTPGGGSPSPGDGPPRTPFVEDADTVVIEDVPRDDDTTATVPHPLAPAPMSSPAPGQAAAPGATPSIAPHAAPPPVPPAAPAPPPSPSPDGATQEELDPTLPHPLMAAEQLTSPPPVRLSQRFGQARRAQSRFGQRPVRRSTVLLVTIIVALVAVGLGFGLYFRSMQRRVQRTLQVLDEALVQGDPESYREAEARLAGLAQVHPNEEGIHARLAQVAVLRALRYDGGDRARLTAESSIRSAQAAGASDSALPALAFLKILEGESASAVRLARQAVRDSPAPGARLALGLALKAEGQLTAAEEQLALSWSTTHATIAGCELASVQRRRGRYGEARTTLDALAKVAPRDLCGRLERVLLLRATGSEGTRAEREALRAPAAPHPALRARHSYLEALVAAAEGELGQVREHLAAAAKAAPWEPEYVWALGQAHLGRGGDARQALKLLEANLKVAGVPEAPVDLATAQLRLGRAPEALALLESVDVKLLPEPQRRRVAHLKLEARRDHLHRNAVKVYCTALERNSAADDDALLTCAIAALDWLDLASARRLAARVRRPDLRPAAQGLALLAQGDPTGAAARLTRAASGHIDPGRMGLLFARALSAGSRQEAARQALREAVVADARSVRTRVALARTLGATGHKDEARKLLDDVLTDKPTAPRVADDLARVFLALGEPKRAAAVLEPFKTDSKTARLRLTAGLVALAAGDPAAARQELQGAVAADPAYAAPRFELARLAARAGRFDDATARYDAAVRATPNDPYLRLRLAVAQAEAGYREEALASLQVAQKGLEAVGARGLVARAYLRLAQLEAQSGDAKRAKSALKLYQQAAALPGAPAAVVFQVARFRERQRDLKEAQSGYRSAIQRDPLLAEAHLRLGILLAADRKSRPEAVAQLRAYLKLHPDGDHAKRAQAMVARLGAD